MLNKTCGILGLIPANNEAEHIVDVVTGVRAYLPVVVVDDGSVDNTAYLAEWAGAQVLRQVPNQGKGFALRTGFREALASNYKAIITLDADGQHDPAEIPKFIKVYTNHHCDLIIGARNFRKIPMVRRMANRIGQVAFSWAMGKTIPDNQSGYRLISRRLMEVLLVSKEEGFEFEVEMIVTCLRQGFIIDWVPIRTIYAGENSHIHPWHHTVNFFRMVLHARRTMRP
jgi:glycosyltransferase involved in cell wall biosynthesis